MITLEIHYFLNDVVWKPRYDITSAVSFFKKILELKKQHIWFTIEISEL